MNPRQLLLASAFLWLTTHPAPAPVTVLPATPKPAQKASLPPKLRFLLKTWRLEPLNTDGWRTNSARGQLTITASDDARRLHFKGFVESSGVFGQGATWGCSAQWDGWVNVSDIKVDEIGFVQSTPVFAGKGSAFEQAAPGTHFTKDNKERREWSTDRFEAYGFDQGFTVRGGGDIMANFKVAK